MEIIAFYKIISTLANSIEIPKIPLFLLEMTILFLYRLMNKQN